MINIHLINRLKNLKMSHPNPNDQVGGTGTNNNTPIIGKIVYTKRPVVGQKAKVIKNNSQDAVAPGSNAKSPDTENSNEVLPGNDKPELLEEEGWEKSEGCFAPNCNEVAQYYCAFCAVALYCSQDCQEADSASHFKFCEQHQLANGNTKNTVDNKIPDIMPSASTSASVSISNTEDTSITNTIYQEEPLIVLPKRATKGINKVCVDCCQEIELFNRDPSQPLVIGKCQSCGWPVCKAEDCDPYLSLHSQEECHYLSRLKNYSLWDHDIGYATFILLRMLLLKKTNTVVFNQMLELARKRGKPINGTPVHRLYFIEWCRYIHKFDDSAYSDEEMEAVWNVLHFNFVAIVDFENSVVLSDINKRPKLALGLYAAGLKQFEHSCRPNLMHAITNGGKLIVSSQYCRGNAKLTVNNDISSTFLPTKQRQSRLQKYCNIAKCDCTRCLDESECETYFTGIPCDCKRSKAFLLPKLSKDYSSKKIRTSEEGLWACSNCGKSQPGKNMLSGLLKIQNGLEYYYKVTTEDRVVENVITDITTPTEFSVNLNSFITRIVEADLLHDTHHLIFEYAVKNLQLLDANIRLYCTSDNYNEESLITYLGSNYIVSANSVDKIFRSFLPFGCNLEGPVPRIMALIKICYFIKFFGETRMQLLLLKEQEQYDIVNYSSEVVDDEPVDDVDHKNIRATFIQLKEHLERYVLDVQDGVSALRFRNGPLKFTADYRGALDTALLNTMTKAVLKYMEDKIGYFTYNEEMNILSEYIMCIDKNLKKIETKKI